MKWKAIAEKYREYLAKDTNECPPDVKGQCEHESLFRCRACWDEWAKKETGQ